MRTLPSEGQIGRFKWLATTSTQRNKSKGVGASKKNLPNHMASRPKSSHLSHDHSGMCNSTELLHVVICKCEGEEIGIVCLMILITRQNCQDVTTLNNPPESNLSPPC